MLAHLSWSWGFEVDPGGGEGYLLAWERVIKCVESSGGKASAAGLGLSRSFQASAEEGWVALGILWLASVLFVCLCFLAALGLHCCA